MPNHCSNVISIALDKDHPEAREFFDKMVTAVREGRFYNLIIPMPECLEGVMAGSYGSGTEEQTALEARYEQNRKECGYANWYDFCVAEWGTKWDVYDQDIVDIDEDDLSIVFTCNSAWSPPEGVFDVLSEMSVIETFRCSYFESGMGFVGYSLNGIDNCFYIDNFTVDWIVDNIPADLCEDFGLYEYAAECEAFNEEYA